MRRRIRKAEIKFLSLCPRGKNKMQVLYKADDGQVEFQCLVKDDNIEQGELLACVYAPEHRDSEGDIASSEVIKEMAYSHARNGAQLDIRHDGKPLKKEDAFVAENFLIQKEDPRFQGLKDRDGKVIDPTGGWGILLKIENEKLREKYRSGDWNGVSLFGDGLMEIEKDDIKEALEDLLEKKLGGGESMKPEELKKALEESNKALATSIVEGVVTALQKSQDPAPKDDDKKTDEPTELLFKGDPTDVEALQKHAAELQKQKLLKDVDWTNPEAVLAHAATLQKATDDADDSDDTDTSTETPEQRIARLEKENRSLRKATNQRTPERSDADDEVSGLVEAGLTKEDALLWQRGKALGQAINKRRGYAMN